MVLSNEIGLARLVAFLLVISVSLIPALSYSLSALLFNRFRRWSDKSLGLYLLEVLTGTIACTLAFEAIIGIESIRFFAELKALSPNLSIGSLPIVFGFAVLSVAVISLGESKVRNRLEIADQLIKNLEKQGRVLTLSEAELKGQVSQFLHDRVQSKLMVISMRLQELVQTETRENAELISKAISELEALRVQDLRLAIQTLSPDLDSTDLEYAISNLAASSLDKMSLKVELDKKAEALSPEGKMAVYKITEQAILNSLIHGRASEVMVSLQTESPNSWTLAIADNGQSKSKTGRPGLGTAVIDAWVRVINGTKKVQHTPQGYRLEIGFSVN